MSEIKTKIRTYNDVIDLFGEEKAADMLSEALDWSTIDPKNDKKNIMERKPLLLDPYMTYEGEDYCKHIVAGFLGDRDLDWASGYIDEEKIKNGQVMPVDTVNGRSFEGKGVAAVLDMYDPDGVPVIAYFFPNGYGTKTNDNGCSNVIASLYGRDNFTSYLARAANEEKILYIDSEKYEQMEKELPRYGGTRFPPALAALSMDIIIPSSYICKMKAEINPKLSDREREHNSLNRTMHIKVADSRRNRLAQDRDKPRNITLRYDDDNRDSQ